LKMSLKTRAKPSPLPSPGVCKTEKPGGIIKERLTVESLEHQVSVIARKSRS
jgi:hypothetical protein